MLLKSTELGPRAPLWFEKIWPSFPHIISPKSFMAGWVPNSLPGTNVIIGPAWAKVGQNAMTAIANTLPIILGERIQASPRGTALNATTRPLRRLD